MLVKACVLDLVRRHLSALIARFVYDRRVWLREAFTEAAGTAQCDHTEHTHEQEVPQRASVESSD
jgi:hypothetical protein